MAAIGVFDSGTGGLTVVKQLRQVLPNEDIIYIGDLKRMPYGPYKPQKIIHYMQQFLNFLAQKKVKMGVIACNTMTSWGYKLLDGQYAYPLIPMDTAAEEALQAAGEKCIGIIATEATVRRDFHRERILQLQKRAEVFARPCPEFVPLIESGHIDDVPLQEAVANAMQAFAKKNIGALILGCTHYPIVQKTINRYLPEDVEIIDPAIITARKAQERLLAMGLADTKSTAGHCEYYFSADLEHAKKMVQLILADDNPVIHTINLDDFS